MLVMQKKEIWQKINEIFSRGVGEGYGLEGGSSKQNDKSRSVGVREVIARHAQGERRKAPVVKFGVDPTRPDIHLGHAAVLAKLRALQELGCKVVFVVGDFTAQIGDPSGRSKARPEIEQKEVERNMKTYLEQVGKILRTDEKHFSWVRNSEWFYNVTDIAPPKNVELNVKKDGENISASVSPRSFIGKAAAFESTRMQKTHLKKKHIIGVSLRGFLSTLRAISYSRLIERDMFQDRINGGGELAMHEMMYPVLQGLDSVMIAQIYGSCDLEVGGTDQTFNMLLGRDVMKANGLSPQGVLSSRLLVGTDGKEKMSKSEDNTIMITDEPADMYGKVMSLPDAALEEFFELCTYTPTSERETLLASSGERMRDVKMRLAREVVAIHHGQEKAETAQEQFKGIFQRSEVPPNTPKVKVAVGEKLFNALKSGGIVDSRSEFCRLVEQGAIREVGGEKITDSKYTLKHEMVVKVGKKRFLNIVVS